MSVMNAQPPLPIGPVAGAVSIGEAVALVQDGDGGRVFLRGELVYAWSADDVPLRRLAAVQMVANKAAWVGDVAAAFGVDNGTLWRWGQHLSATGVGALVPDQDSRHGVIIREFSGRVLTSQERCRGSGFGRRSGPHPVLSSGYGPSVGN